MNKPISVCFISLGSYPLFNPSVQQTFGGAEVQMFLLAQELSQDPSYKVHFVVGDFGQAAEEQYGAITVHKGIPKKKRTFFSQFFPRSKVLLFFLLKKINADITIQRSASAGTGLICFIMHLFKKKFVYMTAHDIDCNGEFESDNPFFIGRFFRYGIRHADCVITQSERHQKMITDFHKKESVILNSGYAVPEESSLDTTNKKHVLWVGRCEDWKRPEVFIELAEKNPSEQFIFIAPKANQSDYYTTIQQQLESAPENFLHIEYVSFQDIDEYFKNAKLFVNTSVYEGFPNTFVQALKNQTPVLSLKVNPDSVLEREKCGVCANDDIDLFFSEFQRLIQDTSAREQLGKNGYFYIKEHHNIVLVVQRLREILKGLL